MKLTSPFQLLAFEPCAQPGRPPSPCRVVGFDSACSSATSSPSSVLEGLDSQQLSCQAPSVTGDRLPSQPLLRTSSLGQQLRQQAALQLQLPGARLSIRTRSAAGGGGGGGRGLSLARARSSQLPAPGAAMAPVAAAAALDPCAATLPSAGGMALARQQSATIEIPNRCGRAAPCNRDPMRAVRAVGLSSQHAQREQVAGVSMHLGLAHSVRALQLRHPSGPLLPAALACPHTHPAPQAAQGQDLPKGGAGR